MENFGKDFNNRLKLCLITLFLFGNYFAVFGIKHAEAARRLYREGSKDQAAKEADIAKKWALWGLIPSTAINIILIYFCVIFILWMVHFINRAML